jgi:ribosomal protein S18 acetylase RimI-like enzyme
VLYRLHTADDFSALYAIEEACFEPTFRFSRGYLRRLLTSERTVTWVAEEDNHIAGFATVRLDADLERVTAYIETIEVDREWRGRGVGGELLRRMESSAHTAGATMLWLHVDAENISAIRLYEAHGFGLQGREENFYQRGRAALIYAKPVAAPGQSAAPES